MVFTVGLSMGEAIANGTPKAVHRSKEYSPLRYRGSPETSTV